MCMHIYLEGVVPHEYCCPVFETGSLIGLVCVDNWPVSPWDLLVSSSPKLGFHGIKLSPHSWLYNMHFTDLAVYQSSCICSWCGTLNRNQGLVHTWETLPDWPVLSAPHPLSLVVILRLGLTVSLADVELTL